MLSYPTYNCFLLSKKELYSLIDAKLVPFTKKEVYKISKKGGLVGIYHGVKFFIQPLIKEKK